MYQQSVLTDSPCNGYHLMMEILICGDCAAARRINILSRNKFAVFLSLIIGLRE